MTDEILEQEFYERLLESGLDEDSARILTTEAREDGMFDV